MRRIQAQAGEALEEPPDRGVRFEPGEVHADADVRAVRERDVVPRVLAPHVEAVGVGEEARIAVRAGERDARRARRRPIEAPASSTSRVA